jgi:hypothetical protein
LVLINTKINTKTSSAGVPLELDEGKGFMSFRIGLFGLDKIHNIERTRENLRKVIDSPSFQKTASRL